MEDVPKSDKKQRQTHPPRWVARRKKSQGLSRRPFPVELRLKAVKLRLEEGYPLELVA